MIPGSASGEVLRACVMTLLEPVTEVTVTALEDDMGGVLGDLATRRGRVTASTARAGAVTITATMPLAEMFGYADRLRSRTHGGARSPPGQRVAHPHRPSPFAITRCASPGGIPLGT
jgi:translation elongation factor EF-G